MIQSEHNREDLAYFLALQEAAFPDSPQYTPARWNRRADFWEQERKRQCKGDERVTATMEFLKARGILVPGLQVADIGCGPGRFAAAFAQEGCQVVGLDISSKMVEHGNAYLSSLGLQKVQLHCCDFSQLDIEATGCKGAFDLVFSSLTPAIHNQAGLVKSMEMSRGWCLNVSHIHRENQLRGQILREVFGREPSQDTGGRAFYTLFNVLFLMGYEPETSFFHRRKEKRIQPNEEYAAYILEHALPVEMQTVKNVQAVKDWLLAHREHDGLLTEVSQGTYGRILWDVRRQTPRPDYRSVLK